MNNPDFYIITGGPGTGKTALLHALEAENAIIVPEAARQVIREQMDIDGNGLPWKDKKYYTDLMLKASISAYKEVASNTASGPCFFDRGIPDALCYASMIGYDLTDTMLQEAIAYTYHKTVFILPPWKEIYLTDNERKQSWEEAEATYYKLKETYLLYGYHTVEVPKGSVAERRNFIFNHIKYAYYEQLPGKP